jgi:alpha-L-rhamnosidase
VTTKPEVEFTSTPYYFTDVTILAKAAKLLGKEADYKKYSALATKINNAFNAKYLNKQTASYGKGMQTELSMPLYWGMVPEDMKSKVAANLAKRVQQDSLHLNVGLLGTKSILNALSENGYAEMAYTIAAQKTYPSWGWWMVNGATTLYENWPLNAKSDISRNHIMFGEVGAWLFKGIAGIRPDEQAPGFKNAILELNFIDSLESYAAMHKGPYGNIQCSWKKGNGLIESTITVPPNSTATLHFPIAANKKLYAEGQLVNNTNPLVRYTGKSAAGKSMYQLQAGTYHFSIR